MPRYIRALPHWGCRAPSELAVTFLAIVLPKSFVEKQIRFFRFWFNHQLQDGLHYQNELFHCLQTADGAERFQLYRLGSQLAQQGADIIVTHQQDRYSLWVSLRSQPKLLKSLQSCLAPVPFTSAELQPNFFAYRNVRSHQENVLMERPDLDSKLSNAKRKVIGR